MVYKGFFIKKKEEILSTKLIGERGRRDPKNFRQENLLLREFSKEFFFKGICKFIREPVTVQTAGSLFLIFLDWWLLQITMSPRYMFCYEG